MKGREDMKKLIRTVPKSNGDDYDIHEDIMIVDMPMIVLNESHDPKDSVCIGCCKNKPLEGKDFCKECQEKLDNGIQIDMMNNV